MDILERTVRWKNVQTSALIMVHVNAKQENVIVIIHIMENHAKKWNAKTTVQFMENATLIPETVHVKKDGEKKTVV